MSLFAVWKNIQWNKVQYLGEKVPLRVICAAHRLKIGPLGIIPRVHWVRFAFTLQPCTIDIRPDLINMPPSS
jgi:branched-subunit amino acid permease